MNEELMRELHLVLGRLNGVHAALVVIAGSLPPSAALAAAAQLREGTERVHADALALPLADVQISEMHRVMRELTMVLETAGQAPQ